VNFVSQTIICVWISWCCIACTLWMSCTIRAVVWVTNYETREFKGRSKEREFDSKILWEWEWKWVTLGKGTGKEFLLYGNERIRSPRALAYTSFTEERFTGRFATRLYTRRRFNTHSVWMLHWPVAVLTARVQHTCCKWVADPMKTNLPLCNAD